MDVEQLKAEAYKRGMEDAAKIVSTKPIKIAGLINTGKAYRAALAAAIRAENKST